MKNPYAKGKGRIHPSPSSSPANPRTEALAVLRMLPAAIIALTSALGNSDKEVLAYLIVRSIGGLEETVAEQRRCGMPGELHTRLFGCGCFDCYTSFWSRWDCSPDRELIHIAIEAFEDHLATSQRTNVSGKGRRRGSLPEKGKKRGKEKEKKKEKLADDISSEPICEENKKPAEEAAVVRSETVEKTDRDTAGFEQAPTAEIISGNDRRKGWADVTAIFNSRLWSLWSPGD